MTEISNNKREMKPNMPPLGCGRGPERGVCDDPDCAPCDEEAERLERAMEGPGSVVKKCAHGRPVGNFCEMCNAHMKSLRDTTTTCTCCRIGCVECDSKPDQTTNLVCEKHGDVGHLIGTGYCAEWGKAQADERARIERIIKSMAPHGWDDAGSFVLRDDVLAAIRGEGDDA